MPQLETTRPRSGLTGTLGPKVYIVCNQSDTGPAWGYILRQKGLTVLMETSLERAVDHWLEDVPDVTVVDLDSTHEERMLLCRHIREISAMPLILLLPGHHETEMLEAYATGVDDCVVKPISPAIFLAKVLAWAQRSWTVPVEGIRPVQTAHWALDPPTRALVHKAGTRIGLTNLEFRLLNLLMTKPSHVFLTEELVRTVWGNYGHGDEVLLKNVVYRLRKKMSGGANATGPLHTWQGGYSFDDSILPG